LLPPFFYLGRRIRDEEVLGSGSGVKHPGSATLPMWGSKKNIFFKRKIAAVPVPVQFFTNIRKVWSTRGGTGNLWSCSGCSP
jgi:hypothetical protein